MGSRRGSGVSGAPSAFAGGYSEAIKRQLEGVTLPEKIKCKICKKYRNAHAYSKRQLDIFRHARVVEGQRANNVGYASCRNCTGGQVMELRCCVCDQIKGLDDFAINQRKEHELARCLDCVQGHKEADPVVDENKLLTDDGLSTTQGTMTMSYIDSSITGSTRQLTASGTLGDGSSLAGVNENIPSGGGVWVEPERHDTHSSKAGWVSYGVQRSNATASVRADAKDRKFAKVPAWRSEIPENPPARIPDLKNHVGFDDDEDEDITGYL
ncbi:hypothetical protein ASPSYDRAFT_89737 [Aspergillus sydowii CBS 593.65]|uniref:Stc1 domain-containing protein n=1 Tax=Aspergillus sydowii CBS 593.65 TaxID=1036612 RepID=A0A1L9THV6_9EURO|nr:uncharacterized protein ASPSYDRAFT_89737 [Aspergillus sydowii CBS 593.65]OJJ59016.1 hypothetical protein ASPSYDRAFT_89737 [Aspergillus sydowii CBS 593.65]